jgi:ABC-type nitrate/sulfonate/bicarbonate transport system substrate-binding protein
MILAAGCSAQGGSGAALTSVVPKPEQPDITVAAIPAVDLVGLYIARDRGLFARQGLHVTIVPVPSAQSVITGQLVTDPDGFPAMPGTLQNGAWRAAFLAEPYITAAVGAEIQRVARAMGQTGILGRDDTTEAEQRALVSSMT